MTYKTFQDIKTHVFSIDLPSETLEFIQHSKECSLSENFDDGWVPGDYFYSILDQDTREQAVYNGYVLTRKIKNYEYSIDFYEYEYKISTKGLWILFLHKEYRKLRNVII